MIWYTLGLLLLALNALIAAIVFYSKAFYGLAIALLLAAWATTFGVRA